MSGLNTAQIIDRARSLGYNLTSDQANQILSQAWDQNQYGADAGKVDSLIGGSGSSAQTGGGATGGYPGFNFDWTQADKDALEKLRPYYEQKLKDAGDSVDLAKSRIEEDYQTGARTSQTAYDTTVGNAQTDYGNNMQQEGQTEQKEMYDTRGSLNSRGVLLSEGAADGSTSSAPVSGYAQNTFMAPMTEQQMARKQAIELALTRQQQVARQALDTQTERYTTDKRRGIEDQDIAFKKYRTDLDQEKQDKAMNQMAPLAYQQAYQKYKYLNNIPG